ERRDDPRYQIEQRCLAAARRPEQRISAALPPRHRNRFKRKRFRRVIAGVGVREIDEVNTSHPAFPHTPVGELPGEATRRPAPSNTKTLLGSSTASSTCPGGNSCTPCSTATQLEDSRLRCTKLSDPVISVTVTVALNAWRPAIPLATSIWWARKPTR